MKRLFAKLTGGRVCGLRFFPCRKPRARAQPPVSFSRELDDAIESAIVDARSPNDDVQRIMVVCHALGHAFIFDQDVAADRIRKAFPNLTDEAVARGVRLLEKRVRPVHRAAVRGPVRPSWVTGWMGER
jgi:hypothetical protein